MVVAPIAATGSARSISVRDPPSITRERPWKDAFGTTSKAREPRTGSIRDGRHRIISPRHSRAQWQQSGGGDSGHRVIGGCSSENPWGSETPNRDRIAPVRSADVVAPLPRRRGPRPSPRQRRAWPRRRALEGPRDLRPPPSAPGAPPDGGPARLRAIDQVLLAAAGRVIPHDPWVHFTRATRERSSSVPTNRDADA